MKPSFLLCLTCLPDLVVVGGPAGAGASAADGAGDGVSGCIGGATEMEGVVVGVGVGKACGPCCGPGGCFGLRPLMTLLAALASAAKTAG